LQYLGLKLGKFEKETEYEKFRDFFTLFFRRAFEKDVLLRLPTDFMISEEVELEDPIEEN